MKSYLKLLMALLLVIACVFSYVACDGGTTPPEGGGEGDVTPPEGGEGETPEEEEETWLLDFVYRYTRESINQNGRKEKKDTTIYVDTLEIPVSNEGLTAELKAQIAAISYHGYGFADWYPGYDKNLEVPGVTGEAIDFDSLGKITGDMVFYATRGDLAGKSATWAITEETVDEVTETVLTISGTGAMFDFANANNVDIPWGEDLAKITKVVIAEGITTIGSNSFANCTALKDVTYASTIKSIGDYAFYKCAKIKSLITPANVEVIGKNAYSDCTGITTLVLNEGLKVIGASAFQGANKFATVILPASLTTIQSAAFHPGGGQSVNSHALKRVYTFATEEQFANVSIDLDNDWLYRLASVFYYSETESFGPYWEFATDKDGNKTDTPIQKSYVVKYMLPSYQGSKLPIWVDYIPVTAVTDAEGNPTFDADGFPVVEGKVTQANVDFVKDKKYNGYEFVKFSATVGSTTVKIHEVGTVITGDVTVNCGSHITSGATGYTGILSDDGGIKWKFLPTTGVLTVYKDATVAETEGRKPFEIWDFNGQDDTARLWAAANASAGKISSIVIEDGVEYIGRLTFASAVNVKTVYIPASVKAIHAEAFAGCTLLNALYFEDAEITDVKVLYGMGEKRKEVGNITEAAELAKQGYFTAGITAPTAYGFTETATGEDGAYWMDIGTSRIAWVLEDSENGKKLTVGGDADIMDFSTDVTAPNAAPWHPAKDTITDLAFAPHITTIGENLVNGYENLQYVSIPNKITIIPASAFAGTALIADEDQYDENGLLIVDRVLIKAWDLDFIEIPRGTTTVAGGAFDDCSVIAAMFVPTTLKYIHPEAFANVAPEVVYYEAMAQGWDSIAKDLTFAVEPFVAYMTEAPTEDTEPVDGTWYIDEFGDYVIVGCIHKWTEWVYTVVPTCTTEGSRTHRCNGECQQTVEEVVAPTGHKWSEWTDSETLVGKENRTCLNGCGETESRDKVIEGQVGFVNNFNTGTLADMKKEGKITTSLTEGAFNPDGAGFVTIKDKGDGDKYILFGRGKTGGGEAAVILQGATGSENCDPDKIIITWDMIVESDTLKTGASKDGQWPFRIRFGGTSDDTAKQYLIFNEAKGDADQWTNMDGVFTDSDLKTKASFALDTKKWHNFFMIYDTTTGLSELYIDGEFIGYVKPHANYKDGPVKNIDSIQFHTRGQTYYDCPVAVGLDNFVIMPWDSDITGSEFVFDDQIDVNSMIALGNGASVSTGAAAVAPDAKYDATKGGYATLAGDDTNKYLEIGRGDGAGEIKYNVIGKPNYTPGTKTVFYAEFDVKVLDIVRDASKSGPDWPIRIRVGGTADNNSLANICLKSKATADDKTMTLAGNKTTSTSADFSEWVKVSVIYDTTVADAKERVKVYFNGEYAGSGYVYEHTAPAELTNICFETRGNGHYDTVRYAVDNIKMASLIDAKMLSMYFTPADNGGTEPTPPAGGDQGGTTPPATGTITQVTTSGTPAVDADGKMTFETGNAKDYFNAGKLNAGDAKLSFENEPTTIAYAMVVTDGTNKFLKFAQTAASGDPYLRVMLNKKDAAGKAYVFETDMYFEAGTAPGRSDNVVFECLGGVGEGAASTSNAYDGGSFRILYKDSKYILDCAGKEVEMTTKKWFKLRIESLYTDDGKLEQRFYIDGVLQAVKAGNTPSNVEPDAFRLRWKWQTADGVVYFDNMVFEKVTTLPAVQAPAT